MEKKKTVQQHLTLVRFCSNQNKEQRHPKEESGQVPKNVSEEEKRNYF